MMPTPQPANALRARDPQFLGLPTIAAPSLAIPSLAVPSLAVPSLAVPTLAIPSLTVPSLAVPTLAVPTLAIPSLTIPGLSVPTTLLTLPAIPSLTGLLSIPSLTAPALIPTDIAAALEALPTEILDVACSCFNIEALLQGGYTSTVTVTAATTTTVSTVSGTTTVTVTATSTSVTTLEPSQTTTKVVTSTTTNVISQPTVFDTGLTYYVFEQPSGQNSFSSSSYKSTNYNQRGTINNLASVNVGTNEQLLMPGQSTSISGRYVGVVFQGFFYASESGTYNIDMSSDDWGVGWIGDTAYDAWDDSNANFVSQFPYDASIDITVVAGEVIPLTLIWQNDDGIGSPGVTITTPGGVTYSDTTSFFVQFCEAFTP